MSKTELHSMILDWWMDEDEPDEPESTEDIEPDKIEAWEADIDQLVTQHDHQNWLMVSVLKLVTLVKRKKSHFSYLTQLRYQT